MEEKEEEKQDLVENKEILVEEVKEEIVEKKEKKPSSKKKILLIGTVILAVALIICGIFLWIDSNRTVDEKEFLITSITPKSKNEYVSNNELTIVLVSFERFLLNEIFLSMRTIWIVYFLVD